MSTTAAGWHPDPYHRFEFRYWDGAAWTEHVTTAGQAGTDPLPAVAPQELGGIGEFGHTDSGHVQRQVQQQAGITAGGAGGGTLFTEPVLVVNQKAKLIELSNEYTVFDQHGNRIGAVRQVGQSAGRKVLRALTNVDQFLTHKYELCDSAGQPQLQLVRPAKVFKSTVVVSNPSAHELGRIVQENVIGKIRFGLEAGGHRYGSMNAENWRAWNFQITDHTGAEVARITKTWEGFAKALFTTADNYVVQIHRPLEEPLRSLVVAAAVTVDTALKQDE